MIIFLSGYGHTDFGTEFLKSECDLFKALFLFCFLLMDQCFRLNSIFVPICGLYNSIKLYAFLHL